jgi:aspartyl-tRNA(Asn)/glutamyl-tRNA(Gln) amidotransferase subunit C
MRAKGARTVIERKTVEHIAHLARLEVSEEEIASFTRELGAILEYVEQLNEIDTEKVEPTAFMVPEHDPLRDDTVRESLPADAILKNGPSVKKGFFTVPKVIT